MGVRGERDADPSIRLATVLPEHLHLAFLRVFYFPPGLMDFLLSLRPAPPARPAMLEGVFRFVGRARFTGFDRPGGTRV